METMQKQMSDQQRLFDEQRSLHSTVVDDYQSRLDVLALEKAEQHESLMTLEDKVLTVTHQNERMQEEVKTLRRSSVAFSHTGIKLGEDPAADTIIKQLEIGTTVQSAARATAEQVARQVAQQKCPGDPSAAEAAARQALQAYDAVHESGSSGVSSLSTGGGGKDKAFVWWTKHLKDFPKWPGDRAIKERPRAWEDYWESVLSFKAQTGCPENIMVQYIINTAPQGSELASACQLLRYSHPDENMHPDKFDFERFKDRLVKHKVAPQGHVLLLNAVKEYDGLCRKYHEKIPLWFARYDRVKQLLLDRCPSTLGAAMHSCRQEEHRPET